MSDFCVIIPDRGDRPKFTEFCFHQLSRMTLKPVKIYHINEPPKLGLKDITYRIRKGVERAITDGVEKCYIIENDDFYPADYFEQMAFDGDFVGTTQSLYYHIFNQTYEHLVHPGRASLFNTGFTISALKGFKWPDDSVAFLDMRIWRHAKRSFKQCKFINNSIGVGIKHGIGMSGGSGHRMEFKRKDINFEYLKSAVDNEAFDFYTSL